MTDSGHTILQIVPRLPGSYDGVGDYASRLAEYLKTGYGAETIFVAQPFDSVSRSAHIILHYVNYGYHERGLPVKLPAVLTQWKESCGGKLLTVFHELYASAPPWRSAFWLQPWQKAIARKIARISDACIVSSEFMRDMLLRIEPAASISVHPVISTIGEPTASSGQLVRRDPHRWAIFGGTHLVKRSLNSFRERAESIPDYCVPRELFVLGGRDDEETRRTISHIRGINSHYQPAIEADVASHLLSSCSFGWIDYFHQPKVPTVVILKSGSFASYCAHGVIPVFPQTGSQISVANDRLPGPYYVAHDRVNLPAKSERERISSDICDWYTRRAALENLARGIAAALQLGQT